MGPYLSWASMEVIMDFVRTKLFEVADSVDVAVRTAGQTFGFLSDERERVEISNLEECTEVRFADLPDEGWPGFVVRLPRSAAFSLANSGVLTRSALFRSWTPLDQLEAELAAAGLERPTSESSWKLHLDRGVTLKVAAATGKSLFAVSQRRDPDWMVASMKEHVRRKTGSGPER